MSLNVLMGAVLRDSNIEEIKRERGEIMNKLHVDIMLQEGASPPEYSTDGSAGFDIASLHNVYLESGETKLVKTGLYMAVPQGYELQLRPRSGLSLKTGLRIPNSPATVDSDYRGEIKVIVENTSDEVTVIKKGDRICQGVFNEVPCGIFNVVTTLDETERGNGGFGHTGR